MRVVNFLFILSFLLFGSENILVFDISSSSKDAKEQIIKINKELSKSQYLGSRPPPAVKSIKVDNKWILCCDVKDINQTNRIKMALYKEYPFSLIVKSSDYHSESKIKNRNTSALKWIILLLIGVFVIAGVVFLMFRASKLKRMQDDIESKQKELMNQIVESQEYV